MRCSRPESRSVPARGSWRTSSRLSRSTSWVRFLRAIPPFLLLSLACSSTAWGQEVVCRTIHERAEHNHWVVTVNSVPVIVIRAGAGFESLGDRCRHTEEHLEEAFERLHSRLSQGKSEPGFVIESCDGLPCIYLMGTEIIRVHNVDAFAYRARGRDPFPHERHITTRMVAEYWKALLQDAALLSNGQEPSTLSDLEETAILSHLSHLYREARERGGREVMARPIQELVLDLDEEEEHPLEHLVLKIPRRFHPSGQIAMIEPPPSPEVEEAVTPPPPSEIVEPPPKKNGGSGLVVVLLLLVGAVFGALLVFLFLRGHPHYRP